MAKMAVMNTSTGEIEVRHNVAAKRFETEVDSHLAVIDYFRREREIVMTHTYVPAELRGRGIAEKLLRAALEQVRADGLRVVPACSYVEAFFEKHPEYQTLRA
jgi:predicted GNAT family acetyltransferase